MYCDHCVSWLIVEETYSSPFSVDTHYPRINMHVYTKSIKPGCNNYSVMLVLDIEIHTNSLTLPLLIFFLRFSN